MRILREAFTGIAAALLTSLLVMGAIVLAITEGMILPTPEAVAEVKTPDPMETLQFAFTTPTSRPKSLLVAVPTQPAASPCPMPAGWETYITLQGDNLKALADARQTTLENLVEANCMSGTTLIAHIRLYLPPAPTATATPLIPTATFTPTITRTLCAPPSGWIRYLVRPGDNLYQIATMYGTSWQNLQRGNCMGSSVMIYPGNSIYVPNVAPRFTATSTLFNPSATPKPSPTRTITVRPTITFTFTFTPTTLPPTHTFTPTPTRSVPTDTSTPTSTFTSTPTATSSATPPPTATPNPTSTDTLTPTGTNLPIATSTPTAIMTATNTTTGN